MDFSCLPNTVWQGKTYTLGDGLTIVRYNPHGKPTRALLEPQMETLVKEQLPEMVGKVSGWFKGHLWVLMWEDRVVVGFIVVERGQLRGNTYVLLVKTYLVDTKRGAGRKGLGRVLVHTALMELGDEDVLADIYVEDYPTSNECMRQVAELHDLTMVPVGIVRGKVVDFHRNPNAGPGDCVEFLITKDQRKFWALAKQCGAWDGEGGEEEEVQEVQEAQAAASDAIAQAPTRRRGRPTRAESVTGAARDSVVAAQKKGKA